MKYQGNISNMFLIFKQDLILLKTVSVLLSHCELYNYIFRYEDRHYYS